MEHLSQLKRVVCPPLEEGSGEARRKPAEVSAQHLRKVIQRQLVAYKRQDAVKGLRFNLKVDHILRLKEAQSNRCAASNIELLWLTSQRTHNSSVLDNTMAHIRDNTRLTCLECNRKRGYVRTSSGGSCVSEGTASSSSRTKPRCGASSPYR